MKSLELIMLILAVIIGALVGARNGKRDFQPPLRSHWELFLVGIPGGFFFSLLVLPESLQAFCYAAVAGIVTGIGYSYSLPRQWRYQRGHQKE